MDIRKQIMCQKITFQHFESTHKYIKNKIEIIIKIRFYYDVIIHFN